MRIDFFFDKTINEIIDISPDDLPFTYLKGYSDFLSKNYDGKTIIAFSKEIDAFIIFSCLKKRFLKNVQFLSVPFCKANLLEDSYQEHFLNEVVESLKKSKIADRILPPRNYVIFSKTPYRSEFCGFGTYVVDLTRSVDEMYSSVHPKHRNMISKAQRVGVVIKTGKDQLPTFYSLYKETMDRSNMFCESLDFFISFYDNLTEKNCMCAVSYHNDIPQGALLVPFTKYCCYYVYGASANDMVEASSNNYLHWFTMLKMKKLGVNRYDFVGSRLTDVSDIKLKGIQNFKERFGGVLQRGYIFKKDLSNLKCKAFDSLVAIKQLTTGKKVFKDIIDQENEKK